MVMRDIVVLAIGLVLGLLLIGWRRGRRLRALFDSLRDVDITALAGYRHGRLEDLSLADRAVTQQDGGVQVTAAVLSARESRAFFGTDLARSGIQPVWLEVNNAEETPFWLLSAGPRRRLLLGARGGARPALAVRPVREPADGRVLRSGAVPQSGAPRDETGGLRLHQPGRGHQAGLDRSRGSPVRGDEELHLPPAGAGPEDRQQPSRRRQHLPAASPSFASRPRRTCARRWSDCRRGPPTRREPPEGIR